jgi:hypothetical protein
MRTAVPTMLTREMELALREKICDISPFGAASARFDAQENT